jgi:hypothetical protein
VAILATIGALAPPPPEADPSITLRLDPRGSCPSRKEPPQSKDRLTTRRHRRRWPPVVVAEVEEGRKAEAISEMRSRS